MTGYHDLKNVTYKGNSNGNYLFLDSEGNIWVFYEFDNEEGLVYDDKCNLKVVSDNCECIITQCDKL